MSVSDACFALPFATAAVLARADFADGPLVASEALGQVGEASSMLLVSLS